MTRGSLSLLLILITAACDRTNTLADGWACEPANGGAAGASWLFFLDDSGRGSAVIDFEFPPPSRQWPKGELVSQSVSAHDILLAPGAGCGKADQGLTVAEL